MREKMIEQKLVKAVKAKGGLCLKFVSPSFDGIPDRLILFPVGKIAFAELKASGKKPRPLQIARHKTLMKLGFQVFIIDGAEQIKTIIDEMIGGDTK